jgi:hypothetical protein
MTRSCSPIVVVSTRGPVTLSLGRAESSGVQHRKMTFPIAPFELPSELAQPLLQVALAWANHPKRPKPRTEVLEHWDHLIADWTADIALPLFIRKVANNRGSAVQHPSGRTLVPSDNSPAHWALALAVLGEMPTLAQVREMIAHDKIPVAMVLKGRERTIAQFVCTLNQVINPNAAGWKVAHIRAIGLASRTPIDQVSESALRDHFQRFLTPRNMFLVPRAYAGLGELPEMCSAIEAIQRPA